MRAAFMLVASDADRPMCYMIQHGIGITLHNFTLHTLHLGHIFPPNMNSSEVGHRTSSVGWTQTIVSTIQQINSCPDKASMRLSVLA